MSGLSAATAARPAVTRPASGDPNSGGPDSGGPDSGGPAQRLLAAAPAVVLFTLATGLGQLIAVLAGFAPAPQVWQIVLGLGMAGAIGVAAAPLIRAAYAALVRHVDGRPSRVRHDPVTPDGSAESDLTAPGRAGATPRRLFAAAPDGRKLATATVGRRPGAGRVATAHRITAPASQTPASRDRPRWRHRHRRRHATTHAVAPATDRTQVSTPPPATRRPPASAPPSVRRIAAVAAAVLLLALVCWLRAGDPGRVLFAVARGAFGLFAYALPAVAVLALVPPADAVRGPVPWEVLTRRDRTGADLLRLGRSLAVAARDKLLGRPAGVVLATLALFHMLRGSPGLEAGAYRLAGGLFGMLAATPVAAVVSAASAIGLGLAVLVCAALVTAGHLYPHIGRYPTTAVLAALIAGPLAATGASHHFGYDHYLGASTDRVVVIAGLSPHHHHRVYDSGVALAEVPTALHPVLRGGLKVEGKAQGLRIAAALSEPARATADSLPDGDLRLRTGECFSFVGGTSNFRYITPCNGEHTGEVFYVGRMPFALDPGAQVRAAAARGICEKAYGAYLGVPFGSSYVSMDPPIVEGGGWRPHPLMACVFAALGPWPLKDTRTIAAVQQKLDWSPGPGCRADTDSGLRLVAEQPGTRCVAPGKAVPQSSGAPLFIDAEFRALGRGAGSGRVGVGCLAGDASTGYFVTVGGDGVLDLVKQLGGQRVRLATAGRARSSPSPQTATTNLQVTCRAGEGGVQIVATAGRNRQLSYDDRDHPVMVLSPRLVVEATEAAVTANVTIFSAVLAR